MNEAHVGLLAAARSKSPECFDRDEEILVGNAKELRFGSFARVIAYWEQLADPDGVEERAEAAWRARRFSHSKTLDGNWFSQGMFDPIGARSGPVAQGDRAGVVRTGLGRCPVEGGRKRAARRSGPHSGPAAGRRIGGVARRAQAMPAGARLPQPLFSVFVGYETFVGRICELSSGAVERVTFEVPTE